MNKFYAYLLTLSTIFISFNSFYGQFEENKGQIYDESGIFRNDVHFVSHFNGEDIFFTDKGLVHYYKKIEPAKFDLILSGKMANPYSPQEWEEIMKAYVKGEYTGDGFKSSGKCYRIDMTFPGADLSNASGEEIRIETNNYFLPQNPEGISGVRNYDRIRYSNAYPGIDLIFYKESGGLKYDFELGPNSNPEQIKILYKGHQDVSIDENGNVVVKILPGEIVEHSPVSFQGDKRIESAYKLSGDTIGFELSNYDVSQPVRIDPALVWSTYFHDAGTSGAFTYTRPVWDAAGNMFVVLDTYNRTTFPLVNPGGTAYYNITAGSTGLQLVIMKYNASRQVIWTTYYPASQTSRTNFSNQCLTIDQNDAIYVTGQLSFPFGSPTPAFALYNPGGGAYYETGVGNGRNFVLKFANDGTRLWATMFHTTTASSSGLNFTGLSIDANNKLVASGQTYTPSSWALMPLANPGGSHYYRATAIESRVPTLHRFNTSLGLEWGTYISQGIASSYNANVNSSLVLDQSNNIFLATDAGQVFGAGTPTPYTLVNPGGGAYQDNGNTNTNNGRKISIFKFTSTGALYWNTLYGGNSSANSVIWQDIRDLAVDSNGDVFLVGRANTTNFPTLNPGGGAYMKTTLSTGSTSVYDGVILQFSNNGVRKWATYIGGNGTSDGTDIWGISMQSNDNFIIAGLSRTTNTFPVLSQSGSYNQSSTTGAYSAVLSEFNNVGVQQWGSYYGDQAWISSGGFGGNYASKSVLLGEVNASYTIPTVDPGGGAYYQTAHEASASQTDYIAEFSGCTAETNTTSTATICESATKPLTSSGAGAGSWSIVSGGGSISGSTYTPANVSTATSVTIRYTDGCGGTSDVTFTVNAESLAPTSIAGTTTICSGSSTTLTLSGGAAGTGATAQWFTGSCGGTAAGTGNSITVSPTANTTYFVRYAGTCNTTACASVAVTVNSNSTAPTSISGTTTICSGSSTTLTIVGGSAGTGATAQWFTGSCGGTAAGTGNSITVSPTANTTYYVRYAGTCNTTTCASVSVTVNTNSVAPTSISGTTTICSGSSTTLTLVGGTAGTGAIAQWFTGSCGGTSAGTGNSITVSPTSSTTYFVRYAGTCNTTTCASVTVNMSTNSVAPTSISGTTTICSGSSTTLTLVGGTAGTGATAEWFTGSCGGTAAGTGNSITVSPTANTTYFVRYAGTCNTTTCASVSVTVNSSSVAPTSISGTSTICSGSSTTLTLVGGTAGTGATAEWFTGSCGGTSAGTGNSITVSPTSNTTYYVRYAGTCNTTTCASQLVTVNTNSVAPTSISGTSTICTGSSTTLTLVGGTAGTGATAEWFTGSCGGTSAGTGNSITVSPTANTTYYVRYAGTCNTTTCASQLVTVNPLDDPSFSYSGGTFCLTGTDPVATITGLSGGTFSINFGGTINASTGEVDLNANGLQIYTVTYLTNGSCPTSTTASVSVTSAPDATFSYAGTPYCSNGTNPVVTFGAGASGGVFSSTAGLSISSSTGEIDLSLSTPNTYTVSNDIAASGGCAAANATTSVTITAADDATFSYSGSTYCLTGTDPTPTISGTAGGTFASTPAGLSLNAGTGEIVLATSGTNTYDVTYTTGGTCPENSTVQVTITSSPTADFSYVGTPYCEGSGVAAVTFGVGSSGGVFSDQGATGDLVINASNGEVDLNTSVPGTYTVENFIAAGGGCVAATGTNTITITAQDDATFDYNGTTTFCESDANPIANITGTAGGSFTFTPSGITVDGATGEIDISATTPGVTYDIIYTTAGTCPDNSTLSITINGSPSIPTVSTTATGNTICEGESADISAAGSIGAGVTYVVFDALTGGTNLGATPLTVSPTTTTTYYVESFNGNGCGNVGGRQAVTITVNPIPSLSAGNDETLCPGDNVTLTATGTGSVVWSTTETTASITVSPASTTTYTVVLTDGNMCTNTDDVIVTVVSNGGSLVAVDDAFSSESGATTNMDVLLNDTFGGTTTTIITIPTNGTATSNLDGSVDYISNTGFVGTDSFEYQICDITCTTICDTALVTVTVDKTIDISVPGGFSPNGDLINDLFVIQGLDAFPDNNLSIFNRWGSLVYEAAPYNNDWDGSSNSSGVIMGDKVTTGTYFYILDLGDGTDPLRGSIEIKKN